jgi:rare lipoprotein A
MSATAAAEPCRLLEAPSKGVVVASWYGREHHGRVTASGERFDEHQLTAAHPWLPLQTIIFVTNLLNGRTVQVRITDRGPGYGRGIDLSQQAAKVLGMEGCGLALVRLTFGNWR